MKILIIYLIIGIILASQENFVPRPDNFWTIILVTVFITILWLPLIVIGIIIGIIDSFINIFQKYE